MIFRNKKNKFKEVFRFYFDCSCKVMFCRNNCGRINYVLFYCMNIIGINKLKGNQLRVNYSQVI